MRRSSGRRDGWKPMRSTALGLLALLLACEPAGVKAPYERLQGRQPLDSETLNGIVRDNDEVLKKWTYNHGHKDQSPDICLAMSGGGMRSAGFNIGVLAALNEIQVGDGSKGSLLGQIDVISAVSGGSYALSWYLSRFHDKPPGMDAQAYRNEILRLDSETQKAFESTGALIPEYGRIPFTAIPSTAIFLAAANSAMMPFNIFFTGVFGWHVNTTPSRDYYENAIASNVPS
jgi:hypothetical protein